ncbi:SH2 domain-containing adapter protein F-like isoform X3 [Astyanax mexicanus]|uniref:SH2 domain-containing adapter protein F-like isoform X3 n=1 Tax=Astyanax mexicanus TaxID=7994 RepID=UPI0020CAE7CC|nr:SH2 domain-containing adapter protein F-like isoform X3 [Astyanax mexicanus]
MARWFKEHLGFKSTKAPPPAPPKPDYRHCHAGAVSAAPGFHHHHPPVPGPLYQSSAQPDILTAYKLQKELDFEDPYTAGGGAPFSGGGSGSASSSPDVKYVSPKHRLIKVETVERSAAVPQAAAAGSVVAVTAVQAPPAGGGSSRSPPSPPVEPESKQEKVIILEDYADPFDVADQVGAAPSVPEKPVENDGYMEPYEAQKMMAEIRGGRCPKDGPIRQLPLYDTPYEPAENGGDSDPERGRCGRESRLPQDDERPPEEYDQPWEWKKDRISKAFAVQFEGGDKCRMSPTKEVKSRPPQRHSSGCLVNTKLSSVDHCGTLGERIDPALPLESQIWYHGAISRTDAESLLRLCKEASYLVRNSETSKNDFSLSLKSSQGFMHMKLSRTKDSKYILGQNSCLFDSVPEIIHFYSSRKLPIKGAEHMSLLYPVAIRTL